MKTRMILLMVIISLLLMAAPATVLAQDTAIVLPNGALPLDVFFESLLLLIYDATYLPFAAGMVVILTALAKRIPFMRPINGNLIALWFTVILWVLWLGATEIGYGGQFESLIAGLTTLGSAALGITVTPIAASRVYGAARSNEVAIIGHSRSQSARREQLQEATPRA